MGGPMILGIKRGSSNSNNATYALKSFAWELVNVLYNGSSSDKQVEYKV